MIFDIKLWPAAGRRRASRRAADMQADGQAKLGRGLKDRPVFAPSQRFESLRTELDLTEPPVALTPFDFPDRRRRIFGWDQNRRAQAWLGIDEIHRLPVVHRR